ncbi:MAG: Lrp/AsnC family transcriptional regulator, partial [Candidatus Methanomethylicia archaeon]
GYIKNYVAILDEKKLGFSTTAFILVSFSYEAGGRKLDQREVAREISKFPEVQEVHIITGDWDMILKVKVRDVNELGQFIVDKLRKVVGVEKTLTSVSLESIKEDTGIPI